MVDFSRYVTVGRVVGVSVQDIELQANIIMITDSGLLQVCYCRQGGGGCWEGQLIFDEQDIELQANIIMITDGGFLQVCYCRQGSGSVSTGH